MFIESPFTGLMKIDLIFQAMRRIRDMPPPRLKNQKVSPQLQGEKKIHLEFLKFFISYIMHISTTLLQLCFIIT